VPSQHVEPFTLEQAVLARGISATSAKSRRRAGLNIGDYFAYALAKENGEPLLFKGAFCDLQMQSPSNTYLPTYSTVTDFARFLGWSTSQPRRTAM
jgi:hypothetical protein